MRSCIRIFGISLLALSVTPWVFAAQDEQAEASTFVEISIEDILEEQIPLDAESTLYRPRNPRDPFVPLDKPKSYLEKGQEGPPGPGRILIGDIRIMGLVEAGGRPMVFFMGPDNKGYWLGEGARLMDGEIASIDMREGFVIFRQRIPDSQSIKPFRELVRRLHLPEREE